MALLLINKNPLHILASLAIHLTFFPNRHTARPSSLKGCSLGAGFPSLSRRRLVLASHQPDLL